LKPENLIFRDPLETSDLLITDFGLSKLVGGNEFLSTTCGTPHYVAPEVLKESGHGKPVDMWAIGVITYVLLCGYTPFWGGETNSTPILYQAIIKGQYEFEEEYWGMVSDQGIILLTQSKRFYFQTFACES
jgi:calcium/calmodulin-dependent protein kinase I